MNKEFQVHKLNQEGINKAVQIAELFDNLMQKLKDHCPAGREFSIVATKLEEASFFAKKSMAMQPLNQIVEETNG